MKLTFVSNYINHHQIPLSNVLYEKLGDNYAFIQTEPMEEERIKLGWDDDFDSIPYLKKYYENGLECKKLIMESDIVVFGGIAGENAAAWCDSAVVEAEPAAMPEPAAEAEGGE